MNFILNHLTDFFAGVAYIIAITNALIIADWIQLRFDTKEAQKPVKTPVNGSEHTLERFKLYYEAY